LGQTPFLMLQIASASFQLLSVLQSMQIVLQTQTKNEDGADQFHKKLLASLFELQFDNIMNLT